jgi:hypothetical protein
MPLTLALRQDMEQRFGHDFSRVQVHSGVAAEQSARDVNAYAYTVGHKIVFGAGRYAPATQEGRRLIAHELTHVVQQSAQGSQLLQRNPDDTNPLDFPKEVIEMPWTGVKGASSKMGYLRDNKFFWRNYAANMGWAVHLSPSNLELIKNGFSPVCDEQWIKHHPQHAAYKGDTLVHHHIGQGSRTVGIPETLHRAHNVMHQQRETVGTPTKTATNPQPVPENRTKVNVREHSTKGPGSRPGKIRGPGISGKNPPEVGKIPPSSAMAGMSPEQLKPVSGAEAADIARIDPATGQVHKADVNLGKAATQGIAQDARTSGFRTAGRGSPVVSSRGVAAELQKMQMTELQMMQTTRVVRYGLEALQVVNGLVDIVRAVNMSVAILAQGSPFAAEIQHAESIDAMAKEIEEHYGSFNLLHQRTQENDPSWNSYYDVYQIQLTILLMESSFDEALKEIERTRKEIQEQRNSLRDALAEKTSALVIALTSLDHAEAILFADAASKIDRSLQTADGRYRSIANSLAFHRGMARAMAQRHELRLRELGETGVFWKIPSDKIRSTSLDEFGYNRRR